LQDPEKTQYERCVKTLLACLKAQTEAAEKPLKDDINLADKHGKGTLYHAVDSKNVFMIKELYSSEDGVKYEPDATKLTAQGWTVLHAAVHTDDLTVVEKLMMYVGDGRGKLLLQTEDKTGRRPLHIAAYKGSDAIVEFISKKCNDLKVDMNKSDKAGNSAAKLAGKANRRRSREMIETFASAAK